ncbi:hypothetical protein BRYFOR_05459 [Marvinbryantia formatexigens DSM 14469]|uniref:Bacterial mobilisation domain-containing protein n=2 Tax=Marvinbryantia TaxID=248744 RepID=C6LA17_9FIRM|nr:hypothetical protein BRYFOR_05459 [Marvinbryantia formatexigens DSM 14469]
MSIAAQKAAKMSTKCRQDGKLPSECWQKDGTRRQKGGRKKAPEKGTSKKSREEIRLMKMRTVTKTFRCTPGEAEELAAGAGKFRVSESEYIRGRVFKKAQPRLPPEIVGLLEEMNYLNLKIGTNINQTMRYCNTKKYITKNDYQKLAVELRKLDEQYERIYRLLEEAVKNGGHETAEDETGSGKQQSSPPEV